ncbi:MAG TPA: hypothetical protein VMG59_03745 [Phycisphaerae bacterium]|nr:hypothetical protein [Phycisphaerae bacterium]
MLQLIMNSDHFFLYFGLLLTLIFLYSNMRYRKKLNQGKSLTYVKNQNIPQSNYRMSLRELLREKSPAPNDRIITQLWRLRRITLSFLLLTPFVIFFAFVSSYTHPGYQPLFAAGFYRYFSRLFIINSQINPIGLLGVILISLAVLAFIVERKMVKHLRQRDMPPQEHNGGNSRGLKGYGD